MADQSLSRQPVLLAFAERTLLIVEWLLTVEKLDHQFHLVRPGSLAETQVRQTKIRCVEGLVVGSSLMVSAAES